MWKGNPVLTAVIFGLPMGFLSLICYSICCADILDADEDEGEEGSDRDLNPRKFTHILKKFFYVLVHEKKE